MSVFTVLTDQCRKSRAGHGSEKPWLDAEAIYFDGEQSRPTLLLCSRVGKTASLPNNAISGEQCKTLNTLRKFNT